MENEDSMYQETLLTQDVKEVDCADKTVNSTEPEESKTKDERSLEDHEEQQHECKQNSVEDKKEKNLTKTLESSHENRQLFTIAHEEDPVDEDGLGNSRTERDFLDVSSVALLRGTVGELERGLRDSRALIKTRDDEIASLRKELEKCREQIHREQLKWQRKSTVVEERAKEIQELQRKLRDSEKTIEELQERIKEFESPYSESDDVVACCSSMMELIDLKIELAKKDQILEETRKNNRYELSGQETIEKAIVAHDGWRRGSGEASRTAAEECERHNQLKLKFLRDAFFYFMIDFHSEEQIKAILAVLAYGDQREDVILQAYRMRQRGKKFTVKEVSSRGLSFLHEEI